MGSFVEGWDQLALEGFLTEAQTLGGLMGVSIENWVVLQRNRFDVYANDEPHIAQTLYMEKATGRYLHRIFGRTIRDGRLDRPSGLKDLAQEIFEHSRVCQGFQDDVKVEPGIILAEGCHPYPRKVDTKCQLIFKDASDQATVCPNCTQALETDPNSVGEPIPDLVENIMTFIVGETKNEPLEDFSFIDVKDPETSLWADQKPSKYSQPDNKTVEKDDKEDDGGTVSHDGLLGTHGNDKELDSHVGNNHQPDDVKTADEAMEITNEGKEKTQEVHCDHCDRTFANPIYYRNHKAYLRRSKRRPQGKIPCKDCGKAHYSFDTLAKHMTKHHDKRLIDLDKYINHPQEVKAMKKPTRCSTCQIYLNGNVMVHRHRTLYHELGDFNCVDCNQHFLTYYHLLLHNYNHHSRVSPYLDPSTEGLDKVKHQDGTTEFVRNGHVCPKCRKCFKGDGDWGRHMKIHHAWSIFTCALCDEMCHYVTDFLAHVKNFHSDKPEIKCPICSDDFCLKEGSQVFMTHFESCAKTQLPMGGQLKPGQCERCGKNFSNSYQLKCHLKSHDGDEQFLCHKCDYGTNQKGVMEDHQRSHLREEGMTHDADGNTLFFFCDQCPKKFTMKRTLNRHIEKVHEGVKRMLKCQSCDATFNSSSMLYIHKRRMHGFVSNRSRRGRQIV